MARPGLSQFLPFLVAHKIVKNTASPRKRFSVYSPCLKKVDQDALGASQVCSSSKHKASREHESSGSEKLMNTRKMHEILNEKSEQFLSKLDDGKQKERQELEFLIETMRAEHDAQVPDSLSPNDIKILLYSSWDLKRKMQYLRKCYQLEKEQRESQREREEAISRVKGLYDDDLNPVVRPDRQRRWMNRWKAVQALRFGQPVVIDMDYDLTELEALQTMKQFQLVYKNNCEHLQPCRLHFTSAHRNVFIDDWLSSEIGKNILADFHSEHFLKLFPKERLIYLVPEGPALDQEELDHEVIYVIGGLASTSPRNRSYQKAKQLGIPCGSFPVEKFVSLKVSSSRDLYLQCVIQILLDKMLCKTWKSALDDNLPDAKYVKYPNIQGPLPSKDAIKARRQFERLQASLKFLSKTSQA